MDNNRLVPWQAVLFDFDGVIADTEWAHYETFNRTVAPYGIRLTEREYLDGYVAFDDKGCFRALFKKKLGRLPTATELRVLIEKKTDMLMACIRRCFRAYPDALALIRRLRASRPRPVLGIVSGAMRVEICTILRRLRLTQAFAFIVAAEDVRRGKPSPEPFLKGYRLACQAAGRRLPKRSVAVIEDSVNGVTAARRAGMVAVGVAHTFPVARLQRAGADIVVRRLTHLPSESGVHL